MRLALRGAGSNANPDTEARFGKSRSELRLIEAVMRVAQSKWPNKTAANLSSTAKVSTRAAEFWLQGKYDLSADALAELLRSEHGLDFLEAILGNARPVWWRLFKRRQKRAQLRDEIKRLQHEFDLADAAD